MALRPEEWILHRQLVAQPGFLLLGDRGRRRRSVRRMETLEPLLTREMDYICFILGGSLTRTDERR